MSKQVVILSAVLLLLSWHKTPVDNKSQIIETLKEEADYFAKKDFAKWSAYWSHNPNVIFTYTAFNQTGMAKGWDELSKIVKSAMDATETAVPNYTREYHNVIIDGNLAVAHFTQQDFMDGEASTKEESRTLRREGGQWKIISSTVINMGSPQPMASKDSTHIAKEKLNTVMSEGGTIIRMADGWGGMAVLYNDIPAGADFAPLMQGLKDNSCHSPHWGYLEEGQMRLKYSDGKEDTIRAGELFYARSGHIPYVDKNVKIMDFSPEKEIKEVFAHMGKKMEELKKKK